MATKPNLIIENSRLKVRGALATVDEQRTYLSAAVSSGGTSLTVLNITGFSVNDYIILGVFGSEEAEIIQVHASTAPSGTTITLTSSGTARAHGIDTPVQRLPYNQIEFSRATTSGGSKTVLTTTALLVDQELTVYDDTTNSTGFAYARFKNSTSSTFSGYSDEQAYADFAYNAIGRLIDRVYSRSNETSEVFMKRAEVLAWIQEYVDNVNDLRTRYSHEESASDKTNTTSTGGETFSLPSDIKYGNEKSIIAVYIEGETPLQWMTEYDWATKLDAIPRSTLNGSVSSGATTITLYDVSNFPTTGTGYVEGDTFTWTGKNGTTQLTGVSGILSHDSGDVVYGSSAVGRPTHYTLLAGTGKLYPAPGTDEDNRPLVIDYWKRLTQPDSENDLLPVPYIAPCLTYCLSCVADKRNDNPTSVKFYDRYREQIRTVLRNERTGQAQYLSPRE